jgi:hypothetical protein
LEFNITLFAVIVSIYPVLGHDRTVMSQLTIIIQLVSSDFYLGAKSHPGLLCSNLQQSLMTLLTRFGQELGLGHTSLIGLSLIKSLVKVTVRLNKACCRSGCESVRLNCPTKTTASLWRDAHFVVSFNYYSEELFLCLFNDTLRTGLCSTKWTTMREECGRAF